MKINLTAAGIGAESHFITLCNPVQLTIASTFVERGGQMLDRNYFYVAAPGIFFGLCFKAQTSR